jgi:proteasome accessory factor A
MPQLPGARIMGVETEFGCLVDSGGEPEQAVELLKDSVFHDMRLGLLDLHSRDEVFEPAESGGFLTNGGRLYIDAVGSHLEYATAECQSLRDLIANDRAGQRIIMRALKESGLSDSVRIYSNSIDHFYGHTFGCHENYLVAMDEDYFSDQAPLLYPFLVTRQIFAGIGRVGGHVLVGGMAPTMADIQANPVDYIWVSQVYQALPDTSVQFQLSQRADHILKTIAGRVRFNRALINPKWEHFYSHEGRQRLHLLFGEQNQSEYAYALKVGTTHLVLKLQEDRLLDHSLDLAHPILALREISRDPTYQWRVRKADGDLIGAIDIQRTYLRLAQEAYKGESEENDWILTEWESVLDGLEKNPMDLGDRLDWVAKKLIVEAYIEDAGTDWEADALHSVDMEYHSIDPASSLFHGWSEANGMRRVVDDLDIVDAMTDPPQNTRALGRGKAITEMIKKNLRRGYAIDWSGIAIGRNGYLDLGDPYETYEEDVTK